MAFCYDAFWPIPDEQFAQHIQNVPGVQPALATMKRLGAEDESFALSETLKRLVKDGGRFIDVQPG